MCLLSFYGNTLAQHAPLSTYIYPELPRAQRHASTEHNQMRQISNWQTYSTLEGSPPVPQLPCSPALCSVVQSSRARQPWAQLQANAAAMVSIGIYVSFSPAELRPSPPPPLSRHRRLSSRSQQQDMALDAGFTTRSPPSRHGPLAPPSPLGDAEMTERLRAGGARGPMRKALVQGCGLQGPGFFSFLFCSRSPPLRPPDALLNAVGQPLTAVGYLPPNRCRSPDTRQDHCTGSRMVLFLLSRTALRWCKGVCSEYGAH